MVVVLFPIVTKYVVTAQTNVCKSNVNEMYNIIRIHNIEDPDCTVKDILDGNCSELSAEFKNYKCPSGKSYYVKEGSIYCPIHGKDGAEGALDPSEGQEKVIPETDLTISETGWPTEDMFDSDGMYNFEAGRIFTHEGNYYIITKQFKIWTGNAKNGPEAVLNWDFMEKFSGKIWDSSAKLEGGKLKEVVNGDLYKDDNGNFYVYIPNSGGWGSMPPASYPGQWYKIPKTQG